MTITYITSIEQSHTALLSLLHFYHTYLYLFLRISARCLHIGSSLALTMWRQEHQEQWPFQLCRCKSIRQRSPLMKPFCRTKLSLCESISFHKRFQQKKSLVSRFKTIIFVLSLRLLPNLYFSSLLEGGLLAKQVQVEQSKQPGPNRRVQIDGSKQMCPK